MAPLSDSGRPVGILIVIRPQPASFNDDEVFMVKRFADLSSLALRNARLVAAERDRAQFESELGESRMREELRAQYLRGVLRAQEHERGRIARDLHDSFAQSLASIILGLKVIEHELPAAGGRVADLREVVVAATTEVRRIAMELRPSTLDDLGLAAALQRLAKDTKERTSIDVTVSVQLGDERLPPELETVLYRVAQEAVTNAIKSAQSATISVSLAVGPDAIGLTIVDDGRGFDREAVEGGLGLIGMEERAAIVGGKLVIDSAPGRGTVVTLTVPRYGPGGVA
jgi:signal transduction histidine kinase